MNNIIRIFLGDLKKMRGNIIAWIIIMGMTVIPCMYAWFNIAASWDPYENASNLKVAVANTDEGYDGDLLPIELNIGDLVTADLRKTNKMNWQFTSRKKAIEGVKSGEYYAAIVIPKSFSNDMMSFFDNNAKHSDIVYYVNEKRNAIAPKVTDKGASNVRNNVSQDFIKSIVDVAMMLMDSVSDTTGQADTKAMMTNLLHNLEGIDSNLSTATATVDSLSTVTGSLADVLETTSGFLDDTAGTAEKTAKKLQKSKKKTKKIASTVDTAVNGLGDLIDQLLSVYDEIDASIDQSFATADSDLAAAKKSLDSVDKEVLVILDRYKTLRASVAALDENIPDDNTPAKTLLATILGEMDASIEKQETLHENLTAASSDTVTTASEFKTYRASLTQDIESARKTLKSMKTDYDTSWKKSMTALLKSLNETMSSVSGVLNGLSDLSGDIGTLTGDSVSDLKTMHDLLADTSKTLKQSDSDLGEVIRALRKSIASGSLDIVDNVMSNDSATLSGFIAAPVELNKISVYEVANYGSAMTPFYSTLAIWVGAVILCAMLKAGLAEERLRKLKNFRHYQAYFGRLILFALIGLVQALLVCSGDLFYLGVQCEHPVLFVLTGLVTSLVFVNLTYTLTLAFGDVGKAICVIMMVLQVAGSGGTFPVEMMPGIFRAVYRFEPFVYSMNAMRECIAGFYGHDYWIYMGKLLLFLVPSLILGLVLRNPVIKLNHWIEEKLESTKIM